MQILVQTYAGRWRTCNDDVSADFPPASCVGTFLSPSILHEGDTVHFLKQRSTEIFILSFDDVKSGLYALLVLAAQDGWSAIFDHAHGWGSDARANGSENDDRTVVRVNSSEQWAVIPLLVYQFLLYACFWPATVAVYISTQRLCSGSALELSEQKSWRRSMQSIRQHYLEFLTREESLVGWKRMRLITSTLAFYRACNITILVSVLFTFLGFSLTDPGQISACEFVNLTCLILHLIEMTMMLLGSPMRYITSAWGRFDILVNLLCVADVAVGFYIVFQDGDAAGRASPSGSPAQALRALRVVRILRGISSHVMLKVLTSATYQVTIDVLGPLLVFVFAIGCSAAVARQMFVQLDDGFVIRKKESAHFDSFSGAMILLSRCVLGDAMLPVIQDITDLCPPLPHGQDDSCATSNETAKLFFLAYALVNRFILYPMLAGKRALKSLPPNISSTNVPPSRSRADRRAGHLRSSDDFLVCASYGFYLLYRGVQYDHELRFC